MEARMGRLQVLPTGFGDGCTRGPQGSLTGGPAVPFSIPV